MQDYLHDADFTLRGEDSAIFCPVGVPPVIAVMLSLVLVQNDNQRMFSTEQCYL